MLLTRFVLGAQRNSILDSRRSGPGPVSVENPRDWTGRAIDYCVGMPVRSCAAEYLVHADRPHREQTRACGLLSVLRPHHVYRPTDASMDGWLLSRNVGREQSRAQGQQTNSTTGEKPGSENPVVTLATRLDVDRRRPVCEIGCGWGGSLQQLLAAGFRRRSELKPPHTARPRSGPALASASSPARLNPRRRSGNSWRGPRSRSSCRIMSWSTPTTPTR